MTKTPDEPTDDTTRIVRADAALRKEEAMSKQSRNKRSGTSESDHDLVGLALSGGGIRSATFCLGVIQAFAKRDKLKDVNYLSTVSGGGYIGAWLSAWIHRKGFSEVNEALAGRSARKDGSVEAPEVTWLRQYSNYLAPRLGMLSADSMTLVATWLRNVLLNLFILIAFLAICFLIPRLLVWPAEKAMHLHVEELGYASAWLGFFLFPTGISLQLSKAMNEDKDGRIELINRTWGVLLLVILPGILTALLATFPLFASVADFPPPFANPPHLPKLALVALALLAASGLLWVGYMLLARHHFVDIVGEALVFLMAYGIAIVVGMGMLLGFEQAFALLASDGKLSQTLFPISLVSSALLSFGPPSVLITFGVVGWVIVGLVGRTYRERTREWWARMNAWFIIIGLVWVTLFSLAFFSASIFRWAFERMYGWLPALAGAGWLGSLVSTLVAKRTPESEQTIGIRVKEIALNVALATVVLGIVFGVAAGVGLAYEGMAGQIEAQRATKEADSLPKTLAGSAPAAPIIMKLEGQSGKPATITLASEPRTDESFHSQLKASFALQELGSHQCFKVYRSNFTLEPREKCNEGFCLPLPMLMLAVCALVLLTFGWRVDVNKFSLHNMYKNRLIRCYLGASRYDVRKAHPFTGFDEADDLPICDLGKSAANRSFDAPVHILNAALNITHGRNLAWQERKAASFTFTPWYCGFELGPSTGDADFSLVPGTNGLRTGGYRNSDKWASMREEQQQHSPQRRTFTLGTAMTTSGAAVSSIRGKGSRPILCFIMTIFNARLGRWSPNPLWTRGWMRSGPSWGLAFLLKELFGYATEASNYVYLSDGGHFDNTGVYELVRRRCKTIIVVDATADVERAMSDLAEMVRKCRVDFGVNIDFDLSALGTSRMLQNTSKGFVVGRITYPCKQEASMGNERTSVRDEEFPGKLVVIKPTLIELAGLGVDVFGYSRTSDSFPQQSTVDQFFSESQFESYRRLGELIATTCLRDQAFPLH